MRPFAIEFVDEGIEARLLLQEVRRGRLALATTQERFAFTVFEQTFKAFGLPTAIRTDNGVPFASAQAIYGLRSLRPAGAADSPGGRADGCDHSAQ